MMNQKTFRHVDKNWLLEDLDSTDTKQGRWYESPSGAMPSVTTVTGWEKQAFFAEWRRKNPKESSRVLRRGNKLHKVIEDYLNNEDINMSTIPPNEAELFLQMKGELDKIDNIYELEVPLWSEAMMLAGRVDCVAEYNGKLSIIDFKGSTRRKRKEDIKNYFLQATAYAVAWQERTGIVIDNFVILVSCENGDVQVFEGNPVNYVPMLLEAIEKYHEEVTVS